MTVIYNHSVYSWQLIEGIYVYIVKAQAQILL